MAQTPLSGPLPHPATGRSFDSPVPPGSGWPDDPATPQTPVASTPARVRRLAATDELAELEARISVCRACPRLVRWREDVARDKRASFADQPYWGRPIAGWGDPHPGILIVGLAPAANGGNRTGRVFTGDSSGDWLFASLHRVGLATQPTSTHAGDGQRLVGARMVATVRCAPPANKPTVTERDTCAPWLRAEIEALAASVRVVVALGGYGWGATLSAYRDAGYDVPRPRPRFAHAGEADLGGVTLLGCYHPSQHNTFTGRLTPAMLDDVFVRARALADSEA
ncbi:uracil-DNA glycosylase [Nocardioides sp.]|uniref:uracil-DNA glycosylase n=1 Tax=Nocardioides sp. TaxID=35761 RepID=UPI002D7E8567|nr:uracil-DNA glycosylase [Nocardioides sp.]HET8960788.1 uracil-DNA glycosylase [Nocardioides sp.]